jgi:hypothetical protein
MDTYTHPIAKIRTLNGYIDVYWSFETRAIRYVCGGIGFERPNQDIRTSLANLFGCPTYWLESRSLILSEGKYKTAFENHHKMAKELLNCEWSDYGMDLMSFQIHLAIGLDLNIREDQFQHLLIQEYQEQVGEDPQIFG